MNTPEPPPNRGSDAVAAPRAPAVPGLRQRSLLGARKFVDYCIQFGCGGAVKVVLQRALGRAPLARCRVRGVPTPVFYRRKATDFAVLRDVFGNRPFDIDFRSPPRVIIDGGANVGYVSLLLANRYPQAKILAVEPDPANCEVFRRNCAAYPQITLVESAIWPSHAALAITNPEAESWAFRVGDASGPAANRRIQSVTMEDLMEMAGASEVDILKLDIEGAEKELFSRHYQQWLPRVRTIIAELHDDLCPGCSAAFFGAVGSRPYACDPSGEYQVVTFLNGTA